MVSAKKIPALQTDHLVEHGSHHWEDGSKVSSLVSIINWMALFSILPISLLIVPCESIAEGFQRSTGNLVPGAPTLSWSPSHQNLIKGEQIELKCSPPEGQKGDIYFFNRINEKGEWKRYQQQIGNTLLVPALRMAPKATFSCSYQGRKMHGTTSQSRESNWGEFIVIDTPADPSLSPDPSEPLYLAGEKIVLTCSTPNTIHEDLSYEFSHTRQNKNETSMKVLDWPEGNNTLDLTVTREDSGLYKCRYREKKYERIIPSEWSRPVSIVVRDPLPPPVLKLHPSSGSLGEGKVLSILCLSSDSNNTKSFHFSQDGVEMNYSHEEPLKSSRDSGLLTLNTIAFLYAKDNKSLQFACRYKENITGRWIMSPWSQMLNITVASVPFAPSVYYSLLVLLVPFLAAPLIFCWCKRKNASGCQRRSDTQEEKEETRLNNLGSENLEREDLQNSELTYGLVMKSSTEIPFEPGTKNLPKTREEYQVIYSEVRV